MSWWRPTESEITDEEILELRSQVDHLFERCQELESAIRDHRSQKADDRCIEDDDRLYAVLHDGIKCDRRVGNKTDMLANCKRFINNRCEAGGWPTYVELEARIAQLEAELKSRKSLDESRTQSLVRDCQS